jgi:hypothetical protein
LWDRIFSQLLHRLDQLKKIARSLWWADGSIVRAHRWASGMNKKTEENDEMVALGHSRVGYTNKIDVLTGVPKLCLL